MSLIHKDLTNLFALFRPFSSPKPPDKSLQHISQQSVVSQNPSAKRIAPVQFFFKVLHLLNIVSPPPPIFLLPASQCYAVTSPASRRYAVTRRTPISELFDLRSSIFDLAPTSLPSCRQFPPIHYTLDALLYPPQAALTRGEQKKLSAVSVQPSA